MADAPGQLVLDSWPMLEWIKGKPSGPHFEALLEHGKAQAVGLSMSRICYGEVLYICRKELLFDDSRMRRVIDVFHEIPILLASATDSRVDTAADLKSRYNISFADAFAAGLAVELKAPLVTGDREFRTLERDGLLTLHWMGA